MVVFMLLLFGFNVGMALMNFAYHNYGVMALNLFAATVCGLCAGVVAKSEAD